MKKLRYSIYFSNNEINIFDYKKNQICSDFFLSLKNDKIINKNEFIKEFTKFLNKNKLPLSLFGSNIQIITNYNYSDLYQETIQNIFFEFFKTIKFTPVTEFLKVSPKVSYLNITTDYLDYHYYQGDLKYIRLPLYLFNNNIKKAYNFLLSNFYRPKKVYIFGNNPEIPKISDKLSKEQDILVIFVENYQTYVIKSSSV